MATVLESSNAPYPYGAVVPVDAVVVGVQAGQERRASRAAQRVGGERVGEREAVALDEAANVRSEQHVVDAHVIGHDHDDVRPGVGRGRGRGCSLVCGKQRRRGVDHPARTRQGDCQQQQYCRLCRPMRTGSTRSRRAGPCRVVLHQAFGLECWRVGGKQAAGGRRGTPRGVRHRATMEGPGTVVRRIAQRGATSPRVLRRAKPGRHHTPRPLGRAVLLLVPRALDDGRRHPPATGGVRSVKPVESTFRSR